MHSSNTIVKYTDDTVVVGLISDNNESAYLEEVEGLSSWCKDNNLDLNVTKTKEIVDFRREKQRFHHMPLMIDGNPVHSPTQVDPVCRTHNQDSTAKSFRHLHQVLQAQG